MRILTRKGTSCSDTVYRWILAGLLLWMMTALEGCEETKTDSSGKTPITVWAHAGQESERTTLTEQVRQFNETHDATEIHITFIPEGSYNAQIQAGAVAGDLPDVLEFDGPFLYAYVWQQRLVPLDNLLPETIQQDLLPSILKQGTYHNHLWSVGTFDSGLGLYGNRSKLKAVGIRMPRSAANAWTIEEFDALLKALAQSDSDRAVLDLKLNYTGEWYTYAYSPFLQSAGGDLIERERYRKADGILNGNASVQALEKVQSWIEKGLVDPNIDDAAFVSGRVALSLGGHWNYRQYAERFGKDLLLIPLPDFGKGAKTGQGSWNWGITATCQHPEAAVQFLIFLLQPEQVLAMSNANGAVPATASAVLRSKRYGKGGPLHLFVQQLTDGSAISRPRTPAYPVISAEFQKAFSRIRSGSDVREALTLAAGNIDMEIKDNQFYPWTGGR